MSDTNEFSLIVPDVDQVAEEVEAKLAVSDRQKEATGNAMEKQADAIMSIDLSDMQSRDKARQAIEQLGGRHHGPLCLAEPHDRFLHQVHRGGGRRRQGDRHQPV
jgi:hypothetical protein